jgi:hypothetical protein
VIVKRGNVADHGCEYALHRYSSPLCPSHDADNSSKSERYDLMDSAYRIFPENLSVPNSGILA